MADNSLYRSQKIVDWVEVLHATMHASGFVRYKCKGHGVAPPPEAQDRRLNMSFNVEICGNWLD